MTDSLLDAEKIDAADYISLRTGVSTEEATSEDNAITSDDTDSTEVGALGSITEEAVLTAPTVVAPAPVPVPVVIKKKEPPFDWKEAAKTLFTAEEKATFNMAEMMIEKKKRMKEVEKNIKNAMDRIQFRLYVEKQEKVEETAGGRMDERTLRSLQRRENNQIEVFDEEDKMTYNEKEALRLAKLAEDKKALADAAARL